jgi:hypothetical protein
MNSSELVASPQAAPPGALSADQPRSRRSAPAALLAVLGLTIVGAALRIYVAHQPIFADELSTYWISATHGLGGVLSLLYGTGRIAHAEITPPLSFLASWLSTRVGDSPELLRTPALLAGTATIPLVYALALRTIPRRAALVATALSAFSPFMIYYSAEARAYGLMMFFLLCSTLALLLALDTGRRRWWVVYAVCSAAAFYSHYTCSFVLAAMLLWVLWAHPEARRSALVANVGAALLVVPWIPGLINDLDSPTLNILSALSPFNVHAVRLDLEHWAIGYPYTIAGRLPDLPGVPALLLLGAATVLAAGGLVRRALSSLRGGLSSGPRLGLRERVNTRILFVLMLAAATPVGETVVSSFGNHIIGVRDLAASWPFLALAAAATLASSGPRLGLAAAALAVLAFALGASKLLETRFQRPNYQAAGEYIAAHAGNHDVVVDSTGALSPGPLTALDLTLSRRLKEFRAGAPTERDHPFTILDPVIPLRTAVRDAVGAAHGARIFLVNPDTGSLPSLSLASTAVAVRYRLVTVRKYDGIVPTLVAVYAETGARSK